MNTRILSGALLLASLLGAAPAAFAHGPGEGDGAEKIGMLQQRALSDAPGKNLLFFTVEYAPGQRSIPHVHGGSVVAYVLEGAVVSQLEGEPQVTYRAGESWYETPGIDHLVSRNASDTQPAKLLVWILNEGDGPVLTPIPAQESR
ncbi:MULTISPECIES: cupin domain-containing protein [unclassified Lysobacter]|uniref:cupin domain-containing protein n=1 Tax=unclassified Lysobacter TaxID=2635362 RepID=UPI001C21A0DD|nr:cupin domain-containing protein [Lysobacter sp. MMG2]MBU8977818.1 cupin domain-containing protein [Lysobacter sp. MMG2]